MIKPPLVSRTKNKETNSEEPNLSSTRLAINLLPLEIILSRKQYSKFSLISKISVIALVVLVFLTSATLALRFSQTFDLKKAEQGLAMAEGKVGTLKDREGQLAALKKRLDSINSILGGDEKRKEIFNLVVYLVPPDIQILEVSVDKNGNMFISLSSSSLSSITTLFDNLGDKEKNSDLISKVDLDGLSLGRDSVYRFSLKIVPKGATK